ncbi:L-lactate dehydrogenase [Rhizobiales bacterium RZME27]|uniref:L-lactate dehydrogenase n=1 Tax=Endobacterium cereale TaxID=2663029 RepID=A0A6A8A9A0_9HYPH|nr:L-lactate dehydrogenase [Endobacterium cereale]MEB2847674.1 L-lactate dehydrogenase [Endobacterium cereale]MQY47865.1 L-lactate dehydrogenase [Endobacterium cereale]
MKVGIIGAGMVGSSVGFALAITGYASEVVIIDRNEVLAIAQAEDIAHAVPFMSATRVRAGGYADLAGAGIVILAAGASQKPGETRLELLGRNTEVFRQIVGQVLAVVSSPIFLVASNPVDAMTFITQRLSGLPPQRVIGSGTVLDTARFRSLIARHLNISPQSIHADVIGEHGDSEVLVWESARASSVDLASFAEQIGSPLTEAVRADIDDNVRNAAYKIIEGKGATYYGIGAGIARIVRAIARDEGAVLTVSLVTDHVAGFEQVALSLPRVIGADGVVADMLPDLSQNEHEALKHSADVLKRITDALQL